MYPKHTLAIAVVSVLALLAQAQEPQPELAGRVTAVDSGSPIEGATIELVPPIVTGPMNFQTAGTDSNGNFRFRKVVVANYFIHVSADGFVSQEYKTDPAKRRASFLRLDSSHSTQGIDFQLIPEAVIRGSVRDGAGKPAASILVSAVRREKAAKGQANYADSVSAIVATNAQGQFVLKGLPADTYLIRAKGYGVLRKVGPGDDFIVHAIDPEGDADKSHQGARYRETWYGGTPTSEGAVPITLKMRDNRDGVQIILE